MEEIAMPAQVAGHLVVLRDGLLAIRAIVMVQQQAQDLQHDITGE
jgi:hypothetical protein